MPTIVHHLLPIAPTPALGDKVWRRVLAVGRGSKSSLAHGVWRRLCATLLVLLLQAPQAWDAERMTRAAQRLGPRAVSGAALLQATLQQQTGRDDDSKLAAINQFFNRRITFGDDLAVWGIADYWASPIELLDKGAGDCEDYAIAKYFSLLALGVPVAKLRLVYVRSQPAGPGVPATAHMVLAYYAAPGTEPLVLDNLITEIRPASRRPDLEPVFSFNSEGLWQGTGQISAGEPTQRLSRWREVIGKAREEGFL
jgi:predicted transglutaminase-like cysteine proteinase